MNDKIYYVTVNETLNAGSIIKEVPESQATHVCLDVHEYHGLLKTLRVVRDRALQQVDKSKTDEHGYLLMRAERRVYRGTGYLAWLITKRTPYSCHMAAQDALNIITRDLHDFYHTILSQSGLSNYDLLRSEATDFSSYCTAEIEHISANYVKGVYEISYWSNSLL